MPGFDDKFDAVWRDLRRVDQLRLVDGRSRVKAWAKNNVVSEHITEIRDFFQRLELAQQRSLKKIADDLPISFPENLPITPLIPEIIQSLKNNQVTIVCGTTGSGKTTQLPKAALAAGLGRRGLIGCTQPRRIAATALATRLAEELGCEYGGEVGAKIRFDNRTADNTVIKFMTDGILLAEARSDRNLNNYDCVILDEAHERSLNIDFLLGVFKEILPKRPDLRIVISSATLQAQRMSEFFGNAPIFEIKGGLHPIEDCYFPELADEELPHAVEKALSFATSLDERGDVLVFLPGEREIREVIEHLTKLKIRNTEFLPLFGRLSSAEQQKIFKHCAHRRVVLATNVAETSLTIPGIRFVIDSGLVRKSRYNPRLRLQELRVEFASRSSIMQRRGRCGRVRDGVCLHLYGEDTFAEAAEYSAPEIQLSSLAGVILQMAELRLPPIETFPFLDPPSAALIREGRTALGDLKAMTSDGKITPLGHELAKLPIDPHFGKLLIDAKRQGELPVMVVIAAALSLPDPAERPFEDLKLADAAHRKFDSQLSDFFGMVKLWRAVHYHEGRPAGESMRAFAKNNYYNLRRLREWKTLVGDLLEIFEPEKNTVSEEETENIVEKYDKIHKMLLTSMPRRLAVYDPENKNYMDMNGKRFVIFPASGLAKCKNPPPWLMFLVLMETGRVYGRCVAEAKPEWLPAVAPHLCRSIYDIARFEPERGYVSVRERVTAGMLPINPGRRRHYGSVDPDKAREIFIVEGLAQGLAESRKCGWLQKFNTNFKRINELAERMRHPGLFLDVDAIIAHFKKVLPSGVCSVKNLEDNWAAQATDYAPALSDMLPPDEDLREDEKRFPAVWKFGGLRFDLHYHFAPGEVDDGVTVMAKEEEIPLLPTDLCDWNVPGYLAWKVETMLKKLPKDLRRQLAPISEKAELFTTAFLDGEIFCERPLADALVEFLSEVEDVEISPALFDDFEPPEFLQLKVAALNKEGKIVKVWKRLPRIAGRNSGVRVRSIKGDNGPWRELPSDFSIPAEINMRKFGKTVYPALTLADNNMFAVANYLDAAEAAKEHGKAIVAYYRLRFAQQVKYLERALKFSNELTMSMFLRYLDYRVDLINLVIKSGLPDDIATLRTASMIEQAFKDASENIGERFDAVKKKLERLYPFIDSVRRLMKRIPETSWSRGDVEVHFNYLMRPGFLRCQEAVEGMERFLRALVTRLERAVGSPLARDEQKGEAIAPFVERFLLVARDTDIADHPALKNFYLLLEEAAIAVYAPEIGLKIKSPVAKLDAQWKSLRL